MKTHRMMTEPSIAMRDTVLDFVYAELEFVESKLLHSSSQPTRTQKVLIKLQKLKKTVKDIRATQQEISVSKAKAMAVARDQVTCLQFLETLRAIMGVNPTSPWDNQRSAEAGARKFWVSAPETLNTGGAAAATPVSAIPGRVNVTMDST